MSSLTGGNAMPLGGIGGRGGSARGAAAVTSAGTGASRATAARMLEVHCTT